MRVLVTGARGFVGRHVLAALEATGAEVHAVTSGSVPATGDARWHRADLLDPNQLAAVVRLVRADSLIHLAWCAKPPQYWRDLDNLRWISATLELVRLFAQAGGRRIVAAGTCAEYDWRDGRCIERVTPLIPETLYGASKAACGLALEALARELRIEAAWARLFFLLGPHDAPERFVPSLIAEMQAGRIARCHAGAQLRDYLYIKDAAEALVALISAQMTGPVNVGSGVPIRLGDLATAVAHRLGCVDRLEIAEGPPDNPLVVAIVDRLRDGVDWRPRYDLSSALDETVQWWTSPEARTLTV